MGTGVLVSGSSINAPISMATGRPVTGSVCVPPSGRTAPVWGWIVTAVIGTCSPVFGSEMAAPYVRSLRLSGALSLVGMGAPVSGLTGYGT